MIDARAVTKRFGSITAVDGVSLRVRAGGILALLGPNGAGKTTLVRVLATLAKPDSGMVLVGGTNAVRDPHGVRRLVGLAGQHAAVEPVLTARENLQLIGRLYGYARPDSRDRAQRILEQFELQSVADRRAGDLSGGLRRRLDLALTLVGHPRVLLLDEPTTGLDLPSRISLWKLVRTIAGSGTTILLTTQYLEEANQLASDIVVLARGRVVASGTPAELKRRIGTHVLEIQVGDDAAIDPASSLLEAMTGAPPSIDHRTRRLSVPVAEGMAAVRDGLAKLGLARVTIDEFNVRRPSLDEVFLAITGDSGAHDAASAGDRVDA